MKKYTKEEVIQYRIKQAKEAFKTAKHDFTGGMIGNSVANRLHYACFHSITALLAKEEIEHKSHKSVKTTFAELYIKTKLLDTSFSKMYNKLFDYRQKGDYTDFVDILSEDIEPYIEQVEKFIEVVERILNENTEG